MEAIGKAISGTISRAMMGTVLEAILRSKWVAIWEQYIYIYIGSDYFRALRVTFNTSGHFNHSRGFNHFLSSLTTRTVYKPIFSLFPTITETGAHTYQ